MNIETVGKTIDKIPVEISYKIIDLFSAGLYSSPNKAFEELVSNSYDAGATKVSVYVPSDKSLTDSIIWVADNGISMDKDGLKEFWKIGESYKPLIEKLDRKPIGKFGIGKLATYILTRKLTLICKSASNNYYAVTMDYADINEFSGEGISLDERELTLNEVKTVLNPLIKLNSQNLMSFDLWGEKAEETWTFAIMSDLKPKASEIKDGRLRWVLSTALPLNPNFELFFNGSLLSSSKLSIEPLKTWVIGKDDKTAEKFKDYESSETEGKPCVNLPNLANVRGEFVLYKDSLLGGKSDELGRSHGIFLHIRNRLINLDDPLIGMPALSHGYFNRSRIIIHADNLNDYITSTREAIKDSAAFSDLRRYIQRKFDEIKTWYQGTVEEEEKRNRASYKIAYASASLSRRPIISIAKRFLSNEISDLVLTEIPKDLSDEEKNLFVKSLEDDLTSEVGIIQNVEWVALKPEEPIAKLDLYNRIAKINLMHPFFANFIEEVKSTLPFQLIALTEILTEALLIDSGIHQDEVREIMWKRDSILRELTFSDKSNAPLVASLLQASVSDSSGLEDSVTKAFTTLGFEAIPIGGDGEPDGLATAYIGPKNSLSNYSVTFDAKSTGKDRIKAKDAYISNIDKHRRKYSADYCCVVAIDFEGANDDESSVNDQAKHLKVNLIKVKDLITLIFLSGPKQVGLNELRDFFEHCHTVNETSHWIAELKGKEVSRGPIKEIIETAYKLNKEDFEPAKLSSLRYKHPDLWKYSEQQLKMIVESLEKLVPGFVNINNDVISIQAHPHKILNEINKTFSANVPAEFLEIYFEAFEI